MAPVRTIGHFLCTFQRNDYLGISQAKLTLVQLQGCDNHTLNSGILSTGTKPTKPTEPYDCQCISNTVCEHAQPDGNTLAMCRRIWGHICNTAHINVAGHTPIDGPATASRSPYTSELRHERASTGDQYPSGRRSQGLNSLTTICMVGWCPQYHCLQVQAGVS
jgi:hypothetical protein